MPPGTSEQRATSKDWPQTPPSHPNPGPGSDQPTESAPSVVISALVDTSQRPRQRDAQRHNPSPIAHRPPHGCLFILCRFRLGPSRRAQRVPSQPVSHHHRQAPAHVLASPQASVQRTLELERQRRRTDLYLIHRRPDFHPTSIDSFSQSDHLPRSRSIHPHHRCSAASALTPGCIAEPAIGGPPDGLGDSLAAEPGTRSPSPSPWRPPSPPPNSPRRRRPRRK